MKVKLTLLLASSFVIQSVMPVYANINVSPFANKQQSAPAFLPVEDAFVFSQLQQADNLNVFWQITEGYYLYKNKLRVTINGNEHTIVGLPEGKDYHDEYFGDVEIFEYELMLSVPVSTLAPASKITIHYQGCAVAGLCYPPMTKTFITQ
ncbi:MULTISPECIES: protein-disulfide reductase DsbD domain-containing protein [unclassified Moritella]|uniref:protein-disulfide reductase DsbD domain-containing protein n=1 Tax=unclassified Moritella TaxID=2637987 RepID=UPI001BAB692A|nr:MULTISPECIES: protein-disulfide reductase DsbD domain-containing protein [unclassified Moritella]QUM86750.1 thiol:disulfide interchange protein [Moritella sp. 28]QUM90977.1 thiol:disulfide interchange protein [Moritella sp. 36]